MIGNIYFEKMEVIFYTKRLLHGFHWWVSYEGKWQYNLTYNWMFLHYITCYSWLTTKSTHF